MWSSPMRTDGKALLAECANDHWACVLPSVGLVLLGFGCDPVGMAPRRLLLLPCDRHLQLLAAGRARCGWLHTQSSADFQGFLHLFPLSSHHPCSCLGLIFVFWCLAGKPCHPSLWLYRTCGPHSPAPLSIPWVQCLELSSQQLCQWVPGFLCGH